MTSKDAMFPGRWLWITAQDQSFAISKCVDTKRVISDRKCAPLAWTLVMIDFGHVSDRARVCRHLTTVNRFSPVFKYCQIYRAFCGDGGKNNQKAVHEL